jgi:hypothetical protein
MRRAVDLKPAILLVGQGLFGAVFGLMGTVVATPLVVCVRELTEYLWVERRLGKDPARESGERSKQAALRFATLRRRDIFPLGGARRFDYTAQTRCAALPPYCSPAPLARATPPLRIWRAGTCW